MHASSAVPSAETTVGIAGSLAGLGVVTFALFPFAIPIVLLTVVSIVPLVLIALPVVLAVAVIAAAWQGVRALGRRAGRRGAMPSAPAPISTPLGGSA